MRLLVIEDDIDIREFLQLTLERESFAVDTASDGQKGSFMARTNDYDAIILDNILPMKSGIEVCKDIRRAGKSTPILFLSVQDNPDEKSLLLDAGADDYMTKPYSHQELLSRLKALIRRMPLLLPSKFYIDDLVLDCSTGEVRRGKKDLYLTRKEFSLLELLLKNKGKIVSRGTILEHVWDIEGNPLSKTVETHILNLRKKIEGKSRKIILNIHGRGYKIAD